MVSLVTILSSRIQAAFIGIWRVIKYGVISSSYNTAVPDNIYLEYTVNDWIKQNTVITVITPIFNVVFIMVEMRGLEKPYAHASDNQYGEAVRK